MTLPFSLRGANINWYSTIKLNVLRAFAAGMVWGIVTLIAGSGSGMSWLGLPFIFGIGYVGAIPMFYLASKIMSTFAGDIGILGVRLVTLVFAIGVAVGDPLVYLLHKYKPEWVPVETFKPVNVTMTLFVTNP